MATGPEYSAYRRRDPLADVVLVTGKGGVGKTTVAAGLAAVAARTRGRGVLVEFGDGESGRRVLDAPGSVRHVVITVDEAIQRVAARLFGNAVMAKLVLRNFAVQRFLRAAPAVRELALLETIRLVAEEHRGVRVVVDMPASGHGIAWLRVPAQLRDLIGAGPIHDIADRLARELLDARACSVVVVSIPERLALQETIELCEAMARQASLAPARLVINRVPSALPEHALELAVGLVATGGPLGRTIEPLRELLEARQAARDEAMAAMAQASPDLPTSPVILPESAVDPRASEVADWLLAEALE